MKTPIDTEIDAIPMHEITGEEAVKQLDPNSLDARKRRKEIRYALYRLRSKEVEDVPIPETIDTSIATTVMIQKGFDGFKNFAITWDVALHDPEVVISRKYSEEEEWERIVQAKFPQLQPDGSVKYPDMDVKKAVDKEAKNQAKIKKRKNKKDN